LFSSNLSLTKDYFVFAKGKNGKNWIKIIFLALLCNAEPPPDG